MRFAFATRAFLSSLSSRRLDWRSGLAFYHIAGKLAAHQYTPVESGRSFNAGGETTHVSYTCGVCRDVHGIVGTKGYIRQDLNVGNFERIKWGGVRQRRSVLHVV